MVHEMSRSIFQPNGFMDTYSHRYEPQLSAADLSIFDCCSMSTSTLSLNGLRQDVLDVHSERAHVDSEVLTEEQPSLPSVVRSTDELLKAMSSVSSGHTILDDTVAQLREPAVGSNPAFKLFCTSGDGRTGFAENIWHEYKDEIHRLYIRESKTLPEVMRIMEAKGFTATYAPHSLCCQ